MMNETAVQAKAGLVWTFLVHGSRSQNVPPTDATLISSMFGSSHLIGIVTLARRLSGINHTYHGKLLHPSFIDRDVRTRDREYKT